jgi:acetylglutamate kinase
MVRHTKLNPGPSKTNIPPATPMARASRMKARLQMAIQASTMVTHQILEKLSISDLRGASTNAIIAHPKGIIQGVDQQRTGKIEKVDNRLLELLIGQDIIPVISPLGFDGEGKTFRVNSDAVALAVAKSLKAAKLIFITTQDGLVFNGELIRQMAVNELDENSQNKENNLPPKDFPKLNMQQKRAVGMYQGHTSSMVAWQKDSWLKFSQMKALAL